MFWETGNHQHGLGNSYRHNSRGSSAKGAVSTGMAYFVIIPTHWIGPLGMKCLCVGMFLYGSAHECVVRQKWVLWRCCPSCSPLMRGGRADLRRSRGAGVGRLQLSIGCELGYQGDGFQKANSVLSFQRLGCFFWSANQGERQIQDCCLFFFCSVVFCFCLLQPEWSWQLNSLA